MSAGDAILDEVKLETKAEPMEEDGACGHSTPAIQSRHRTTKAGKNVQREASQDGESQDRPSSSKT